MIPIRPIWMIIIRHKIRLWSINDHYQSEMRSLLVAYSLLQTVTYTLLAR